MANRVHFFSMARAFVAEGHRVLMFGKDIRSFSHTGVAVVNMNTKMYRSAWGYLRAIQASGDVRVVYVREPRLWYFLMLYNLLYFHLDVSVVYEIHDISRCRIELLATKLFARFSRVVAITQGLKEDLVDKVGVAAENITVLPDGVDLEQYDRVTDVDGLKKQLGIGDSQKCVVYIGHLYEWKGAHILAEAAKLMPEYQVIFVGGHPNDVTAFRSRYVDISNILCVGHVPHEDTVAYARMADVLVLPNSGKTRISKKYTSPLKLFEYMASRRPIVASRLPSICEILTNGRNAILVEPDDPQALTEGIRYVLHSDRAQVLAEQAYRDVQQFTWNIRAKKIISLVISASS